MAARLVGADGARAFVKAIATSTHAATAGLHRYEVRAMTHMPPDPRIPHLYASYDDGEWVAILLEDVDGRHPRHWSARDVGRVSLAVDQLSAAFTPTPWPDAQLLARSARVCTRWWAEAEIGEAPAWLRAHQGELVALEERVPAAVAGNTLCHRDLSADNLLIAPDERVIFIDWAWASQGPLWTDTMHLAGAVVSGGSEIDADAFLEHRPYTCAVDPDILTAYLANLAGAAYVKAWRTGPGNIPALQAFRHSRADALLDWLRRRTGW